MSDDDDDDDDVTGNRTNPMHIFDEFLHSQRIHRTPQAKERSCFAAGLETMGRISTLRFTQARVRFLEEPLQKLRPCELASSS